MKLCKIAGCDKKFYGKDMCKPHYMADYRKAKADEISAQRVDYRERNRDALTEYQRKYVEENRESLAEYRKRYWEENRESLLGYQRQYRIENRETLNARQVEYSAANRDKIHAYHESYRQENPEVFRAAQRRRRSRLAGLFMDSYTETDVLNRTASQCHLCLFSIDPTDRKSWQVEHVIAIDDDGPDGIGNVAPAHTECNARKNKASRSAMPAIWKDATECFEAFHGQPFTSNA